MYRLRGPGRWRAGLASVPPPIANVLVDGDSVGQGRHQVSASTVLERANITHPPLHDRAEMMHRRTGWCKGSEINKTVGADPHATRGGSYLLAEGRLFPISVEASGPLPHYGARHGHPRVDPTQALLAQSKHARE